METFTKPGKDTLYKRFTYRGWDVELYHLPPGIYKRRGVSERWSVNLISQGDRDLPGGYYGRAQPSLQLAVVDAKMAINTYLASHSTKNPIEPIVSQREIEPGHTFRGRTVKSWAVVNNVPTYNGNVAMYLGIVRFSDGTKMYVRVRSRENPLSSTEGIALGLALVGGIGAAIYYATRPAPVM